MFVISVDEVLELQLMPVTEELEQPVNGIRYARQLWKEVMAGCSFEGACEAARKYFERPSVEDAVPLVVEKSGSFSLYLSDESLRESGAVEVLSMQRGAEGKLGQPMFRGRPILKNSVPFRGQSAKQGRTVFRGLQIG